MSAETQEGRRKIRFRTVLAAALIAIVSLGRGYHALKASTLISISNFFKLNWDEATQLGVWDAESRGSR